MPTYSVPSPSGRTVNIEAASEDDAHQLVQQHWFSGLEPSEPSQPKINITPFFTSDQHALAKQIAAKRTGDPDATPTAQDYYHVANSQAQNEEEYAAYAQEQRDALRKQQREQAHQDFVWSEDMPRPPLSEEEMPQPTALQQQQGPWSITNRMAAASALRASRYRRALAALTSRYSR